MIYLYIIFSTEAKRYYIGQSQDPWERLIQHNEISTEKYTGKFNNWEIKAVFEVSDNSGEVRMLENFIKKQKSKKLLLKLIDPEFVPIGTLEKLVRVSLR